MQPIDFSQSAIVANDKTLIHSCSKSLNQGVDVCRFVEGAPVSSFWNFVIPWNERATNAKLKIRFKDKVKEYVVKSSFVKIPISDLVGPVWALEADGPVQALGSVEYDDESYVSVLGYAYFIVLKEGYSPLTLNSNVENFSALCKIEYTNQGRSVFECYK